MSFLPGFRKGFLLAPQQGNKETNTSEPAEKVVSSETDPRRCFCCHKKLPLLPVTCRCGYNYCTKHISAEQHDCTFDYKKAWKDQLSNTLQVVKGDKLVDRI